MASDEQPGLAAEMLAEAETAGVDVAEAYRITTVVPYTEQDPEINTYVKPPQDLDDFFQSYNQTGEIVVDIRPREDDDAG
ncbi:hypothetical protein [Halosimplex pelagicum]|uniref:Uncharacterized protein n=1 Tax=Halosimplex pelagicum TaxID=869886 RepID=A0A7D5PE26_9EURY|nr:hypothetical protein [Halosimplex pelagicum]QLH80999.1 hypothetical protein HZS54_04820 [Halosimplex pelagicum]